MAARADSKWPALAAAAAFAGLAFAGAAAAHEYHASVAEVEHNRETGRLEVALRMIPEDLEAGLSQGRSEAVRLEVTEGVDELIVAYLEARFRVTRPASPPPPLVWVGKEVSHQAAWLYFEIPVDAEVGWTLDDRVLLDLEPAQINTVFFRAGDTRATWTFTAESEPVELPLSRSP